MVGAKMLHGVVYEWKKPVAELNSASTLWKALVHMVKSYRKLTWLL